MALGDGADLFRLAATGRLEGTLDAGGEDDTVWNDGAVAGAVELGSRDGIYRSEGGQLEGDLLMRDGLDQVFNAGPITGDVHLGTNNDIYVGRGGSVGGTVLAEDGFDTFIAGAGVGRFDGARASTRWISRRGGAAGVAGGRLLDEGGRGGPLRGLERVIGSDGGADTLVGDGLANVLDGRDGKDTL